MANLVKKVRTNLGDLQIDYNALANLPAINNNLLINGDFKINQRGSVNYISTNTWKYSVDRWRYIGIMSVTVNDSGTVTLSKTDNSSATYFSQILENVSGIGDFTLSFSVKSISGTLEAYIDSGSGNSSILSVTTAGVYNVTSSTGARSVIFRLQGSTADVELEWAKLERGVKPTPFVSRLPGEELALCRRYYKKYDNTYYIGVGMATNDGIVLSLPQEPMRLRSPQLNILGSTYFNPGDALTTKFVNLTADYAAIHEHIQIVAFQLGTATPGEIGRIYGRFELDAEIY